MTDEPAADNAAGGAKNNNNNNASAPPPPSSSSDARRFDYRLTGWARESHHAPVYCVAFCGKGAVCCGEGGGGGEGGGDSSDEDDEGEEGGIQKVRLDRVFASVGSRRVTVYYAPSLPVRGPGEGEWEKTEEQEQLEQRAERRLQSELPFTALQTYVDASADEEFYVCRWTRLFRQGSSGRRTKSRKEKAKTSSASSSSSSSSLPLLLAAGKRGVLRVIDAGLGGLWWTARGHGGPINDVAAHPTRPALALTASRDQSVRLWNLESRCCAAVLAGGAGAHVAEVLSVDWHPTDPLAFASSGYDSSVKVWSLEGVEGAVEASFGRKAKGRRRRGQGRSGGGGGDSDDDDDGDSHDGDVEEEEEEEEQTDGGALPSAPFAPRVVPSPRFSSQRVHEGVADCVRWLGPGVLLSKAVDDRVLAWGVSGAEGLACPLAPPPPTLRPLLEASADASKPSPSSLVPPPPSALVPPAPPPPRPRDPPRVRLLNSLRLSKADDVYFVRFSLDASGETLACGGREGRVCVFDPRRVPLPAGGPAEPRKKLRCAPPRGVGVRGGVGGGAGGGEEEVVRQTALSDDGSTLLASCDKGTIWRFDRPRRRREQ